MVPLLPYMFITSARRALLISVVVTLLALFVFGYVKGRFTGKTPFRSAIQTTVVGGLGGSSGVRHRQADRLIYCGHATGRPRLTGAILWHEIIVEVVPPSRPTRTTACGRESATSGNYWGLYIVPFLVFAQAVAVLLFKERIGLSVVVGGLLVMAGGILMIVW
jgi:hypothetical protein